MMIWLDLAEIDSVLKKLDWCDRGGEGKEGKGGALRLCNGLIAVMVTYCIGKDAWSVVGFSSAEGIDLLGVQEALEDQNIYNQVSI